MAIYLIGLLIMLTIGAHALETIKPMEEKDAQEVVHLTMQTWKKEYHHILPSEFLDNFPLDMFMKGRRFILSQEKCHCLVALNSSGHLLAFSDAGKSWQSKEEDREAEIYAIYVDPNFQRQGIGQKLFLAQQATLRKEGYQRLVIWTFEQNHKSRHFYEKLGGQLSKMGDKEIDGVKYPSVQYQWNL